MSLLIRALSPELLDDYMRFFERDAFSDNPGWSQCYCMHFHFDPAWDKEENYCQRKRACEYIRDGKLKGYLAYMDAVPVAWCNANDKSNYCGLVRRGELWDSGDGTVKIKSVVCFLVSPSHRGKGIATRMLERVVRDASEEGYDFAEGYAVSDGCDMYAAHHGTVGLFEKCGFSVHKRLEDDIIMRVKL